jgi:hypothetical protein
MALIKIQRFFGAVPNDLLNDPDISFKAKGLYAYLNSKPDNWDFSVEGIASQVKDGVDSVRTGIHELEKSGYLKRVKHQNEKGYWEVDYMLFEEPVDEESYLGKSEEGKPPKQYKKEIQKEKLNKKKEFVAPSEEEVIAYFREKGQTESRARKAFAHYNNFGWKDSKGAQVKNWKQKMQTNWFTETPDQKQITPLDGDARMNALIAKGYKNCTPEELRWVFDWQHRSPGIYYQYADSIRLVKPDSHMTKQDCIDADRAAGFN